MPRLKIIKRFTRLSLLCAVIGVAYMIINYLKTKDTNSPNIEKSISNDINSHFYTDCESEITVPSAFFSRKERIVHLDLKGAPPKLSYFKKVFPLFRDMGATGLLIEYEDTFPYKGKLKKLASPKAYTEDEVKELITLANNNKLTTIIPLVQTFGHMEFVLKHEEFKDLREISEDIRSVLPNYGKSLELIREMITQVSNLHSTSTYFHIGSDEIYILGNSQYSKDYMKQEKIGKAELFLRHVQSVASYTKSLGHRALMWDDMLRSISVKKLLASKISDFVEPMIWRYEPNPEAYIGHDVWDNYKEVFTNVWIASAFKGATGQAQYITDIKHHLTNHETWVNLMKKYGKPVGKHVSIRGTVITGWQRYDHVLPLCELLPVALPSLAFSLQVLKHGCFTRDMHRKMSMDVLRCARVININLRDEVLKGSDSQCSFPGRDIYYGVHALYALKQSLPLVVERATLSRSMRKYLAEIYDDDTVNEWLQTVKL